MRQILQRLPENYGGVTVLSKLSILTVLAVFFFPFLTSYSVSSPPCDDTSLDARFAPYQVVLDDIEARYGIELQLADSEQKEERYAKIFEKSVETFAEEMEETAAFFQELDAIVANSENGIIDLTDPKNAHLLASQDLATEKGAESQDIRQILTISNACVLALNAQVVTDPTTGTKQYASIQSIENLSDRYGYSFELLSSEWTLSSDRRVCSVTVKGYFKHPNGQSDLVLRTFTDSFVVEE